MSADASPSPREAGGGPGWGVAPHTLLLALAATWLGWGFDVFDAHIFNYVAKPTLHALLVPDAQVNSTMAWLQCIFLTGWGVGGILFGRLADRLGRSRVLVLTMVLYGAGTAACAACGSLPSFVVCRLVASLGIGGEWAAGASLLSEIAPDRWRPLLGALMYTASPVAQMVVSAVNRHVVHGDYAGAEANGWRYAYLMGLAPAVLAFVLRVFVAEPARWREHSGEKAPVSALFGPLRRVTVTGVLLATVALVGAWGILGFLSRALEEWGAHAGLGGDMLHAMVDRGNQWALRGGFVGVLSTVPVAMVFGRRDAFAIYFTGALASSCVVLGPLHLPLETRVRTLFFLGFFAHGVFGIFPYYLPELFPTNLRAAGSGFCYSFGRFVSAAGVLVVGRVQEHLGLTQAMLTLSAVYAIGIVSVAFARETGGELT
ncbi:MAG TPA: MFS transporter [Planctomycetota bacterium]|nr:MFS transporter [Planctomycetota bacterium]